MNGTVASNEYENARVRGTILASFRSATFDLWGERGLKEVGQLVSEQVQRDTIATSAMSVDWFPETHVTEWYAGLWNGPCEGSKVEFTRALNRMLDVGFGRVQKVALRFATPKMVVTRAPSLWRHDHSHGNLAVTVEKNSAHLTLDSHPYLGDSLSRTAVTEIYRYCLTLSRADRVTAHHFIEPDGSLCVKLRWTL